jgi:hypothetical protein
VISPNYQQHQWEKTSGSNLDRWLNAPKYQDEFYESFNIPDSSKTRGGNMKKKQLQENIMDVSTMSVRGRKGEEKRRILYECTDSETGTPKYDR